MELPAALARAGRIRSAVLLGSGLSSASSILRDPIALSWAQAGFPEATAIPGHAGRVLVGEIDRSRVAIFEGRLHLYQGLGAWDVCYPVRLASAMGAESMVITNAAGAVDAALSPGDICVIGDHLNLTGEDPLGGRQTEAPYGPFVALDDAYDASLRLLASEEAAAVGMRLTEVVYAGVRGPSYETAAEVEYLRRVGAHVVGMSTVIETIAARAFGMKVLGLSVVTNVAGHDAGAHGSVVAIAEAAAADVGTLLDRVLRRL